MPAYAKECTAKEFLSLSKARPSVQFTPDKDACSKMKNPMLRRRHAFLMAFEGNVPKSRLLLVDGNETAWFSMPIMADDEYAAALVDKAVEIARGWGAGELRGPVSPDGSGFGIGAPMPGSIARSAPWHPERDDALTSALAANGLRAGQHLLELCLSVRGRENPFRGAENWSLARRGLRVEALAYGRKACETAYAASDEEKARGYAAFERVFVRCGTLAPAMKAVVAFHGDAPVGWLLFVPVRGRPFAAGIRKKIGLRGRGSARLLPLGDPAEETPSAGRSAHILHMQILPQYRRSCCAAALLDKAWEMAASFGAESISVSTIDSNNEASLRIARNAGAVTLADYAVFLRKIAPESSI